MNKTLTEEQQYFLRKYPHFTTIEVDFPHGSQYYTYKTVDALKKGDYVVVNSPYSGFTVVKVVKVHKEAKTDRKYSWISQKVDHSRYKSVQSFESMHKDMMKLEMAVEESITELLEERKHR